MFSINAGARGPQMYSETILSPFFWWKREQERRSVHAQQWIECIFQSGAELCAKSPRGLPLLKAISSQNECGSPIGLALISIHLACLCAETAGATAGGWGGTGGVAVSGCNCVCVLCMCVDDTQDKVKPPCWWRYSKQRNHMWWESDWFPVLLRPG